MGRKLETGNRKPETIRLGTRGSALALVQSRMIARRLERTHRGLRVELVEITTTGDAARDRPLKSFGGTGVFVKELENALLLERIDLAVHSLKDLPTKQPRGLVVGAIVGREDTRDVAVIRGVRRLAELPPGSVIGTGSPRRVAQLKARYPQLEFAEIRGNVETRLRKVAEGQYAGTVLARAGLKRLGLLALGSWLLALGKRGRRGARLTVKTLSHGVMLPAPGQGALALECRAGERRVRRLLRAIHNAEVAACVTAEREVLRALGGGCHLPLGALGTKEGRKLRLRAVLARADGRLARAEATGTVERAKAVGRRVARALRRSRG